MLIDTHIWVWWVNGDPQPKPEYQAAITAAQPSGIEVSIISCWEVAKLVEYKRLTLTLPVLDWLEAALSFAGVRLLPLTPEIAAASTQLPGTFHIGLMRRQSANHADCRMSNVYICAISARSSPAAVSPCVIILIPSVGMERYIVSGDVKCAPVGNCLHRE